MVAGQDPARMAPGDRVAEVARILAKGALRWLLEARKSASGHDDGVALSPRERPAEACEDNRNMSDERALRRPVHEVSARRSCWTSTTKPSGPSACSQLHEEIR